MNCLELTDSAGKGEQPSSVSKHVSSRLAPLAGTSARHCGSAKLPTYGSTWHLSPTGSVPAYQRYKSGTAAAMRERHAQHAAANFEARAAQQQ